MSKREINLREARARIGHLVDRAEHAGEVTIITRHGRPAAAIVPLNHIKEPAMTATRLVAGFGDHPDLWGVEDPQPGKIVVFVDRHIYTEGDPMPMIENVASIVEGDMAETDTFDRADAALARLGYRRADDDEWEPSSYGYAARCEPIAGA